MDDHHFGYITKLKAKKKKRKKNTNSLCIKLIEHFVLYLMFSKANFVLAHV